MIKSNEVLNVSSKRVKLNEVVPVEKYNLQQLSYPVKEEESEGVNRKCLVVKDRSIWSGEHMVDAEVDTKEEVFLEVFETVLMEDRGTRKNKKCHQTKSSQPCLFCDDTFQNKGSLKKHVSQAHSDIKQCTLCGQIFATVKVLCEHLYQYHKEKHVKCQICIGLKGTKKYRTSLSLVKHIRKVHNQTESKKIRRQQKCYYNKEQSIKFLGVRNICKLCYVGYKSTDMLEKHFKAIHSAPLPMSHGSVLFNATRYCCNLCPKVYETPGNFLQHFKGNKHNECNICTKRYQTEKSLLLHNIRAHNKCPRSKESFADEESYILHLSTTHRYCSICFERFCSMNDRRRHFERKHQCDGHRNKCNACGKTFSCVSAANTHIERKTCQIKAFEIKHRVMKSLKRARQRAQLTKICYKCKLCNTGSEGLEMMKFHLKFNHQLTKGKEFSNDVYDKCIISSSKVFYCKQCPRVYGSYIGYLRHMETKRHLYCKVCLKHIKNETDLIIHQRRMHEINCAMSPEAFFTKELYYQHLTKQHYVCDMCLVTFCNSKRLYDHKIMVHEMKNTIRYCNICGKCYFNSGSMAYHMKRHVGNHHCKVCNAYFMTNKSLSTHLLMSARCQDGVREFTCLFCSKKYSTSNGRNKHIKKCHDVFVCLMCGSNHTNMEQFDEHKKLCNALKVEAVLN